jgi:hypothetical protein
MSTALAESRTDRSRGNRSVGDSRVGSILPRSITEYDNGPQWPIEIAWARTASPGYFGSDAPDASHASHASGEAKIAAADPAESLTAESLTWAAQLVVHHLAKPGRVTPVLGQAV